jgi:copper chaperone CopZ
MSQASKKELAKLKAQLAGGGDKKRYIHCKNCHNDVKNKKFMVYPVLVVNISVKPKISALISTNVLQRLRKRRKSSMDPNGCDSVLNN